MHPNSKPLAPGLAHDGSSEARLRFWKWQHRTGEAAPGQPTPRVVGVKQDVHKAVRTVMTGHGPELQERVTRIGTVRLKKDGTPRSKTYDRKGKR